MCCAIGGKAIFSLPSSIGCMAFRTLPNRLSADPVKPAVHLIRNSLSFAHWKDRKPLAAALRPIYKAAHSDAAQAALDDFEKGEWGRKFPIISPMWRRQWEQGIPFCLSAGSSENDLHDQCD